MLIITRTNLYYINPIISFPPPPIFYPHLLPVYRLSHQQPTTMNTDYETQIGGRLDNTCPQCRDILGEEEECVYGMTTCICRTVGEYCYSDFPVMYNIWFVSAILLQLWNG